MNSYVFLFSFLIEMSTQMRGYKEVRCEAEPEFFLAQAVDKSQSGDYTEDTLAYIWVEIFFYIISSDWDVK